MEWAYLVVCVLIDIPIIVWFARMLFPGDGDFIDAVVFWFTPDMWSLFAGQFGEDLWAEIKLGVLLFGVGAIVFGEFWFGVNWIGLDLGFGVPFLERIWGGDVSSLQSKPIPSPTPIP